MNRPSLSPHTISHARKPARGFRVVSFALAALLVTMSALTAVVASGSRSAHAQAATPDTASAAPDSTLVYLALDLDASSPQNQQATALLSRLGVDWTIEDIAGEMSSSATGEDITDAIDADALVGGEAAMAIFDFGSDLSALTGMVSGTTAEPAAVAPPTMAVIVSAPDPDAAYASAESALEDEATTNGATITETTYEGVTIRSLPADVTTGDTGGALARVGGFVVYGSTTEAIEPVVDTEAGRTPSLAESDAFQTVSAELNSEWLAFAMVNGQAAADQLSEQAAATGVDLASLDLAQLQSQSGFVLWADEPGFRMDSITIPGEGSTAPIVESYDATLPDQLPASTFGFVDSFNLGASGILDTIFLAALTGLTGSVSSDIATPDPTKSVEELAAEQFAQLETILGFNLKTDLIDQMVGEWGIATWGLDPDAASAMDPSGVKFLLVSGAQTPATISDAVSKLSLLLQAGLSGQGTVTTRVIGEDQVNVLTINDPSVSQPVVVEYGVVGDQFVIGVNGALDEYLADSADSLANSENYQEAMALLPTEQAGQVYVDLEQVVGVVQQVIAATESSFEFEDASELCGDYSTQAAAQEAFDADQSTNWELDQDFDGEACEDFFAAATPEATPVAMDSQYDALKSFAAVSYQRDGMMGASAILVIEE